MGDPLKSKQRYGYLPSVLRELRRADARRQQEAQMGADKVHCDRRKTHVVDKYYSLKGTDPATLTMCYAVHNHS